MAERDHRLPPRPAPAARRDGGLGHARRSGSNAVVRIIAADMVAEVCSCYIMRAGEVLELFATEGLRPEAVHRTRLRVGEGLVGVIAATARPLALADAPVPSRFRLSARDRRGDLPLADGRADPARRPRARRAGGAEPHPAPLHRGRDRGAADHRHGAGRAGGERRAGQSRSSCSRRPASAMLPMRLDGITLNGGLAIGPAVLHEPRIVIRQVVAEDPAAELERLRARRRGDAERDRRAAGGERRRRAAASIATSSRPIACSRADRGWLQRIAEAVRERPHRRGRGAEGAGRQPRAA